MEARELLQLSLTLVGDVESRRVLSLGSPYSLNVVLGCRLEAVKDQRLLASLGRREVGRHSFGGAWRRNMLPWRISTGGIGVGIV